MAEPVGSARAATQPLFDPRGLVIACMAALALWLTSASGVAHADRFGPPWDSQVTADSTVVYSQPDSSSAPVGPLGKGATVVVLGQVTGSDGTSWTSTQVGFIHSSDLAEIHTPWIAAVTSPQPINVYAKPSTQEGVLRTAGQGDLLRVTGVSAGVDGDPNIWWATTEGYVALGTIAPTNSQWAQNWSLPQASDAPNGWWGTVASLANVRAGSSLQAPIVGQLPAGAHVKVLSQEQGDSVGGNNVWYRIDGGRFAGARVHSSLVQRIAPPAANTTAPPDGPPASGTWIVVDRATSSLTLVKNGQAAFTTYVSLGLAGVQTPDGVYSTFGKFLADRMTSRSVPGATHSYDLPNVPFVQYYKDGGYAIHGTYWHDYFGAAQSQGCINVTWTDGAYLFDQTQPSVPSGDLYQWSAPEQSTPVVIVH